MDMQKKILLTVENQQEYDDLVYLLEQGKLTKYFQFFLFTTNKIFDLPDYHNLQENNHLFYSVYYSVNSFDANFKTVSLFKKIVLILKNGLQLRKIIRNENIDILLSGVPLIFHRFAILAKHRIAHIAYVRSLLFGALSGTSISDTIFFITQKISLLRKIRFVKNYYADLILTVGEVNKQILIRKGIPATNIVVCGPIGLKHARDIQQSAVSKKTDLIFITAAYKWHLYKEGDDDQTRNLETICELIAGKYKDKFNLIIRVHPRDDQTQYSRLQKTYSFITEINQEPVSEFLKYTAGGKILISSLSTLAFEWMYLGGTAYFFSSPYLDRALKPIFNLVNITPIYDFDILLDHIRKGIRPRHHDQVINTLYKPANKKPVELAADMIRNYIATLNQ